MNTDRVKEPTAGYQLVLVRPKDFPYIESFRDIIDSLRDGFSELGVPCQMYVNRVAGAGVPILFGAHHLTPEGTAGLPSASIIYNLEQLVPGYPWYTAAYLDLLRRHTVWDCSGANLARHASLGISGAQHLPIGYTPVLERVPVIDQDIDVLFYGVTTPHRQAILDGLRGTGMRVVALNGVFGTERDAWIARSRIVLNLHAQPDGMFEAARVCYLLANRKAVISECVATEEVDADLREGIVAVPAADIPTACHRLLDDEAERRRLATEGYRAITAPARRTAELLRRILPYPSHATSISVAST